MTDKAFKKFAQEDGCWWTQERDVAEAAWQVCSEHYEAVMRRAVEQSFLKLGFNPWGQFHPVVEDIIKHAREER